MSCARSAPTILLKTLKEQKEACPGAIFSKVETGDEEKIAVPFFLSCSSFYFYLKRYAFMRLQNFYDFKNIPRAWIALGTQHPVNALAGFIESFGQALKCNRRIYIIAEHGFARVEVPPDQFIHRLYQHMSAEFGINHGTP
jgi:hypothetical protein